ncbi:Uncharacterised protein [Vibrio cholerae]|nr:Uncharacterised protein [Vibrio cholerae]CSA52095.1 Uncharacterised protein [Vibrio cholerae]CSB33827.1 Uncharacterised protein [Vibrio cholerae]CSB73982.1 Uncharacterised protein [Vibrio cholerae]CSI31086.1 Uncharacterised protein [Vibrio cholerae]
MHNAIFIGDTVLRWGIVRQIGRLMVRIQSQRFLHIQCNAWGHMIIEWLIATAAGYIRNRRDRDRHLRRQCFLITRLSICRHKRDRQLKIPRKIARWDQHQSFQSRN